MLVDAQIVERREARRLTIKFRPPEVWVFDIRHIPITAEEMRGGALGNKPLNLPPRYYRLVAVIHVRRVTQNLSSRVRGRICTWITATRAATT